MFLLSFKFPKLTSWCVKNFNKICFWLHDIQSAFVYYQTVFINTKYLWISVCKIKKYINVTLAVLYKMLFLVAEVSNIQIYTYTKYIMLIGLHTFEAIQNTIECNQFWNMLYCSTVLLSWNQYNSFLMVFHIPINTMFILTY